MHMSPPDNDIHIHVSFSRKAVLRGLTVGVVALGTAIPAWLLASQVPALVSFTAGQPIVASEVNANFAALQAAVNDNDAQLSGKTVFITSTSFAADFGGIPAADGICQALASAADLPGTFLAWLSDGTLAPLDRFTQNAGPYQLVDGRTVAVSFSDLTDGRIRTAIDMDEQGGTVAPAEKVWTNTNGTGAASPGSNHCSGWTVATHVRATLGFADVRGQGWSNGYGPFCDYPAAHLFCFQQ